jgi:hypothetical protein
VHGGHAQADQKAGGGDAPPGHLVLEDLQPGGDGQDCDQARDDGQHGIIGLRQGNPEGQHGDEVHRPDAAAERDRGRDMPKPARDAFGGPELLGHLQRGERGEDGDDVGHEHQEGVVMTRHAMRGTAEA